MQKMQKEYDEFSREINRAEGAGYDGPPRAIIDLARTYELDVADAKDLVDHCYRALSRFPCAHPVAVGDGSLYVLSNDGSAPIATISGAVQVCRIIGDRQLIWSDYCPVGTSKCVELLREKLPEKMLARYKNVMKPVLIVPKNVLIIGVSAGLALRTFDKDSAVEMTISAGVSEIFVFSRADITFASGKKIEKIKECVEATLDNIKTGRPVNIEGVEAVDSRGNIPCNKCLRTDCLLYYCSRCRLVRYCSAECQRAEYPHHKKICKAY
jgi:hypothetical protein